MRVGSKECPMPTKAIEQTSGFAVPIEYAGKWIAWSADHKHILASGTDLPTLWEIVRQRQIVDPIFEKVPRAESDSWGIDEISLPRVCQRLSWVKRLSIDSSPSDFQ